MIKNIIEAYEGKISFVSSQEKGTVFTVTLPKE
jgi:two-component system nitrogen regulation sensor histidine kinase NtrY